MNTDERIEAAAGELYGVPPDDFVPVRDELVGEAREAGDKDAARAIGKLRRPTQAAWLANLLARERGDQLEALLGLAGSLTAAQRTLDGRELRKLSAQRSRLVGAMAKEARRIASADGHRVTETVERDLRGILDAALADPVIADEVRSGRLTRTVSWSGFGLDTGETTVGSRAAPRPTEPAEAPEEPAERGPVRRGTVRAGRGLPGVEPRSRGRAVPPAEGDDGLGADEDTGREAGPGRGPADDDVTDLDLADPDTADQDTAGRGSKGTDRGGAAHSGGHPTDPDPTDPDRTVREAAERQRADAERAEAERAAAERARREHEERERAERELRETLTRTTREAERAADAHEDTVAALRDAESDRDEAGARVDQLTAELERARDARAAAVAAVKEAGRTEREAARTARDAAAERDRAEAALTELTRPG